jgi:hypothetical protein
MLTYPITADHERKLDELLASQKIGMPPDHEYPLFEDGSPFVAKLKALIQEIADDVHREGAESMY